MRKWAVLTYALFFCIIANAQQNRHAFGVKAGVNINRLAGSDSFNKALVGFNVGFSYENVFHKNWSVQSGINLNTKGGVDYQEYDGSNTNTKLRLWYLEVPIVIKYIVHFNEIRISPQIGVFYAYCLDGIAVHQDSRSSWLRPRYDSSMKLLKASDAGVTAGINLGWRYLFIGASYDMGLLNIAAKNRIISGISIPSNLKWHTRTLSITTGVVF